MFGNQNSRNWLFFYEGKNSISAYSPSWFRPFLPLFKTLPGTRVYKAGGPGIPSLFSLTSATQSTAGLEESRSCRLLCENIVKWPTTTQDYIGLSHLDYCGRISPSGVWKCSEFTKSPSYLSLLLWNTSGGLCVQEQLIKGGMYIFTYILTCVSVCTIV